MPKIDATQSKVTAPSELLASSDPWAAVSTLIESEAERRGAVRLAFLASNPEWAACVVPGCFGTVKPDKYPDGSYKYIREVGGLRTGFCPNASTHARLKAEHEAAQAATTSRRLYGSR